MFSSGLLVGTTVGAGSGVPAVEQKASAREVRGYQTGESQTQMQKP
ncbi:MAG: hypothetical protein TR69_WS6001001318 [candidate division WS6 bacterium OLB20]|uniref:Uncharacterized protein n=1 Tax=candidate division WS6 bacterium OLB20 TaxID=1617426 RepID=A0A136LWJ8_9BACT|nr:MAG: hypothetical protein TR69_WS6001001318 [candidate division WS6 bacterium OLB20]